MIVSSSPRNPPRKIFSPENLQHINKDIFDLEILVVTIPSCPKCDLYITQANEKHQAIGANAAYQAASVASYLYSTCPINAGPKKANENISMARASPI